MKKIVLTLLAVPLLVFSMSSSAFTADVAILSCEIITGDNSFKLPAGQHDFQIIVMSFSFNKDGSLIVKKNVEGSCVRVLARLVNDENYKIKSVSSIDNGPAYTLLWKGRAQE